MISMAEYYIIIDREEVGPEVRKLIDVQRQCGCATLSGNGAWIIKNASEQDQKAWFATFERAMDIDFPLPCDECGCEKSDCCCDDDDNGDQPNAQGQPAATEPVKQAGRGPLGCAALLDSEPLPEK